MTWFYYLVIAGFGLIFGSFFNVCIYRMPLGMQLGDRSMCPSCSMMIHWYDNIPLAGFVVLKGRCRGCGSPISWRYPLVELSTALLFVLIYWWSISIVPGEIGVSGGAAFVPELIIGLLMVSVLIISVGADVSNGIVPNKATFPGMILMLVSVVGLSLYRGDPGRIIGSLVSALIGGGFLLFAGILYGLLFMKPGEDTESTESTKDKDADGENGGGNGMDDDRGEEEFRTGIGMGDVKLMIVIGLGLGYFNWYLVAVQLFLGYFVGAVVALIMMVFMGLGRKDRLPFVPFLAIGAIFTLIWGQALVDWYLKLLR